MIKKAEGGRRHLDKRLVAPIVITAFLIVYFLIFAGVCFVLPMPLWAKWTGLIVPLALIGVSLFVLVERIKEVRSGEEDDLSQY